MITKRSHRGENKKFHLQAREDEAWVVNEVEIEGKDEDDGEDVDGERKARVFHGSLTMKDLHPATRWETSNAILSSQLLLLLLTMTSLAGS